MNLTCFRLLCLAQFLVCRLDGFCYTRLLGGDYQAAQQCGGGGLQHSGTHTCCAFSNCAKKLIQTAAFTDKGDRVRYALYRPHLEHEDAAHRANAIICLIHQANYLLDQQLIAMEQAFLKEGGYKEQLFAERIARRATKPDPTDRTDLKNPTCPDCGKPMAVRTARAGANQGSQFWGCTGYPDCKKTLQI